MVLIIVSDVLIHIQIGWYIFVPVHTTSWSQRQSWNPDPLNTEPFALYAICAEQCVLPPGAAADRSGLCSEAAAVSEGFTLCRKSLSPQVDSIDDSS